MKASPGVPHPCDCVQHPCNHRCAASSNRCLVNTHLLGQFLVVGAIYLKTAVFKVERGVVVVTSF